MVLTCAPMLSRFAEGKTDYYARRRLVIQDKNKYHSPKYRFVVRLSNRDVTAQVVYSELEGDRVMAAAYAHELPRYGVKTGLTNYAGCYATGLLCARRLLHKLKLDDKYVGVEEATGEMFNVEEIEDGPRPFTAYLDVGLGLTTTGSRIFAVMKGAVDGGLNIPHNEKRFPGYDAEAKKFEAEVLRARIFGEHISEYMELLRDEDEDAFRSRFASYLKHNISPEQVSEMYANAHAAIRADPSFTKKAPRPETKKRFGKRALNYKQRKDRVKQRKAAFLAKLGADE